MADPVKTPVARAKSTPIPTSPEPSDQKPREYDILNLSDADFLMGRARMLYAAQTLGNDSGFFQDQHGPGFALDSGIKARFGNHMVWGGVGYQFHHTSRPLPQEGKSYLNTHRYGVTGGYRIHLLPEWFSLGAEAFLGFSKFSSYSSIISAGENSFLNPTEGTVYNNNPVAHPVDTTGLSAQLGINVGVWRDIISVGMIFGGDWGGGVEIQSFPSRTSSYHESITPISMMFSLGVEIPALFSDRTW